MGQIAEAKARSAAAGTEAEQAKVKIALAEKEIKEKEPRAKKAEKEGAGLIKELETKRTAVERLRQRVQTSGWDEAKEKELLEKQAEHSQRMNELFEVIIALSHISKLTEATGCLEVQVGSHRLLIFRPHAEF